MNNFTVGNKTYDKLKWVATVILPALGTLYFAIAQIWGLPAAEEVVGTIVAVDTFLGAILGLSSVNYNKQDGADGDILIGGPNEPGAVMVRLNETEDTLQKKNEVRFKVKQIEE